MVDAGTHCMKELAMRSVWKACAVAAGIVASPVQSQETLFFLPGWFTPQHSNFYSFSPFKAPLRDVDGLGVFDTLLRSTRDLNLAPGVVQGMRVSETEGIELTIRDDVVFHNGCLATSEDVAHSILLAAETDEAPVSLVLDDIAGITLLDSRRLLVELEGSARRFPRNLANIPLTLGSAENAQLIDSGLYSEEAVGRFLGHMDPGTADWTNLGDGFLLLAADLPGDGDAQGLVDAVLRDRHRLGVHTAARVGPNSFVFQVADPRTDETDLYNRSRATGGCRAGSIQDWPFIGTGPFLVDHDTSSDRALAVVERNDGWWGDELGIRGPEHVYASRELSFVLGVDTAPIMDASMVQGPGGIVAVPTQSNWFAQGVPSPLADHLDEQSRHAIVGAEWLLLRVLPYDDDRPYIGWKALAIAASSGDFREARAVHLVDPTFGVEPLEWPTTRDGGAGLFLLDAEHLLEQLRREFEHDPGNDFPDTFATVDVTVACPDDFACDIARPLAALEPDVRLRLANEASLATFPDARVVRLPADPGLAITVLAKRIETAMQEATALGSGNLWTREALDELLAAQELPTAAAKAMVLRTFLDRLSEVDLVIPLGRERPGMAVLQSLHQQDFDWRAMLRIDGTLDLSQVGKIGDW